MTLPSGSTLSSTFPTPHGREGRADPVRPLRWQSRSSIPVISRGNSRPARASEMNRSASAWKASSRASPCRCQGASTTGQRATERAPSSRAVCTFSTRFRAWGWKVIRTTSPGDHSASRGRLRATTGQEGFPDTKGRNRDETSEPSRLTSSRIRFSRRRRSSRGVATVPLVVAANWTFLQASCRRSRA